MAKIDIRENEDAKVTEIKFSDDEQLTLLDGTTFYLRGEADEFYINAYDIDHLIKALKKAKEIWYPEVQQNV